MAQRILIADDEPDICDILQFNLEMEGYEVSTALGPISLTAPLPDLILLDVMMTPKSGFEWALELKQDERTAHIPIIFCTAKTLEEDVVQGFALGSDDYIFKPFRISEVKARVKAVLRRTQTHEPEVQERSYTNTENCIKYEGMTLDNQGYLETLVGNPDMPDNTRLTFLEKCLKQSQRMCMLLSDMSTLTRLDEARITRPITMLDASGIIRQIADETAANFERQKIQMVLSIPDSMPMQGDASLVYSLFSNIVNNTLAYATGATRLQVNAKTDNDTYTFQFIDNGVGVPTEHLPHIFERFYRIDKGRSRNFGGTGLGLAVALAIFLLIRSNFSKSASKASDEESIFTQILKCKDKAVIWSLLCEHIRQGNAARLRFVIDAYGTATKAFVKEQYQPLKRTSPLIDEERKALKRQRKQEIITMQQLDPIQMISRNTWYFLGINSCQQMLYSLKCINEPVREHVGNSFSPLPDQYYERFMYTRQLVLKVYSEALTMLETGDFTNANSLRDACTKVQQQISSDRKHALDSMQDGNANINTLLLTIHILQESQELVGNLRHMIRGMNKFAGEAV